MTELSPAKIELLKQVVDIQERSLNGCVEVFSGMQRSSDPEVVAIAEEVLKHLRRNADTLDAMIDSLNATKH